MTFPKQITIRLPELQRTTLNALLQREADRSPSALLARVVATGLCREIALYGDDDEGDLGDDEREPVGEIPPTLSLYLEPDLRVRLASATIGRAGLNLETFVVRLLELGLDAYEDDLEIVENEPTDQDES